MASTIEVNLLSEGKALSSFAPIVISHFITTNYREGSTSLMFARIFSFFQSKPKAKASCPQLVGHTQSVTTAKQALTDVWLNNSNCAIKFIEIGTELWHCGRIPSSELIDNNLALWTTCNPDHQDHYVGSAKSSDIFRAYPPTKLKLITVRKLKAADFNTASLLGFTEQHCSTNHQIMKETLRAWCVDQGLDAVVSINRGPDEVVIIYPADDLKIVDTVSL